MKINIYVMVLLVGLLGLKAATRLATVHAVAAPHPSMSTLVKLTFNPPYEIASPHESLWRDIKSALVPSVYAQSCSGGNCLKPGWKSVSDCRSGCGVTCGKCPDCNSGPCTIYICVEAVTSGGCRPGYNASPSCAGCPDGVGC